MYFGGSGGHQAVVFSYCEIVPTLSVSLGHPRDCQVPSYLLSDYGYRNGGALII